MTPDRRPRRRALPDEDPVLVGEALGVIGEELGLPAPGAMTVLVERWEEIVGPALAPHARLRSLRDGVATIAVDAPAWATELKYLEDTLKARIGDVTGRDVVRSVRVFVEPRS
jgi:predicted nucleic acid-binding Zn ribbon protein